MNLNDLASLSTVDTFECSASDFLAAHPFVPCFRVDFDGGAWFVTTQGLDTVVREYDANPLASALI